MEKQAKENREIITHELEDKNVMAKKVQNQFSPGLRMSYQKRTADDSKPTGAHASHIHKNRRISLYKNCTWRLHSDELQKVSVHISVAANHLWTIAIKELGKSSIDYTRRLNPPLGSPDRVWVKCGAT